MGTDARHLALSPQATGALDCADLFYVRRFDRNCRLKFKRDEEIPPRKALSIIF